PRQPLGRTGRSRARGSVCVHDKVLVNGAKNPADAAVSSMTRGDGHPRWKAVPGGLPASLAEAVDIGFDSTASCGYGSPKFAAGQGVRTMSCTPCESGHEPWRNRSVREAERG